MEGSARITCQFVLEREIESAAQDVREKVAGALRNLPPNILPPIIQKADPDADPVISLVVAGDRNLRETTEIADKQIKRVLETVDGVGEVEPDRRAAARRSASFADADKLNAYGLTHQPRRARDPERERRDPRRPHRARRHRAGRAHAGPHRRGRAVRRDHRRERRTARRSASSDLGRVEDSFAEPRSWNMLEGKAGRRRSRCGGSPAPTPSRSSTRSRSGSTRSQQTLPPGVSRADHPRPVGLHQRLDRLARGAPAVRAACSRAWSSCCSSATCARS